MLIPLLLNSGGYGSRPSHGTKRELSLLPKVTSPTILSPQNWRRP